ncbi:glycosyltransferase family 2 protein [Paenarthrobacter ilicis]|uniref:dolichyl-phosphate beta-glucosyltransferase n=1 Tax=Paenarthrobacter ilicis TaxID=43665 RepID=UPI0030080019
MTLTHPAPVPQRQRPVNTMVPVPVVDLTVPVFNEESRIEDNLRRLHGHLKNWLPYSFRITVADNASTDGTLRIAERLARELPELVVVRLAERGRGKTLRHVWLASPSPVLAYMEADMSTDLSAVAPLLAPLISGHSDLAIGTRSASSSRVTCSALRAVISRSCNSLLRGTLGARFSDAQCGFKAIRADVAQRILPYTTDDGWFFDTELLVIAERSGLRIHEVPVDWTEQPDPRVDVVRTALADLRGMVRLNRSLRRGDVPVRELQAAFGGAPDRTGWPGRLLRAGAWALMYAGIFLACGSFMSPLPANLVGLALATWAGYLLRNPTARP